MGRQVINALIIPLSSKEMGRPDQSLPGGQGGHPDQSLPGGQGGHPDQTLPGDLPIPSHPIYFPLPPGAPYPDQGLPGGQGGHPDQSLPGDQPKPDQGLPGAQPRPDHDLPPFPSHPIVLPPGSGGGWEPVYIWGPPDPRPGTGLPGSQPRPDNTLPGGQGGQPDQTLPPIPPPTDEEKAHVEWKAMWTPTTGWVSFAIVVPGSGMNVPTPSRKR